MAGILRSCFFAAGLFAVAVPLSAVEPSSTSVDQLLRDLRSSRFQVREEASARIATLGVSAIQPLRDAAESMDRETASRALAILDAFTRDADSIVAQQARDALAALENSTNPVVADLANAALVKTEDLPRSAVILPNRVIRPGFPIGGNGLQLQFGIAPGGFSRSTRIINGHREITIQENGRKTVIEDTNGKDIQVRITETVNGAEVTSHFRGADLEDLRKNAPKAAEIYEKETRSVGGPNNNLAQAQAEIARRQAEMKARHDKTVETMRKYSELRRKMNELRAAGQGDTPEYRELERQATEAREALRAVPN